jgi:glycosyltransferase involved in cell wall biosynthesis
MALLRAERPRAICLLVGDGPDKPILDAAIARLGLADTVLFQPPCQTEQIAVWMAAADLVTLPSYAEGCPNVIIEALASGRPVVASNVGGIPELLHDKFGRLVPPRAAAALARGLNETLSQPWDNQWIADKNDRDWTEVALDLHECFDDLIR